jgi:WD40 repeat protein
VSRPLARLASWVNTLVVSPDGSLAVSACEDGSIQLYDLGRRALVDQVRLLGGDGVESLAVAPDGRSLAVGTTRGAILLLRRGSP